MPDLTALLTFKSPHMVEWLSLPGHLERICGRIAGGSPERKDSVTIQVWMSPRVRTDEKEI